MTASPPPAQQTRFWRVPQIEQVELLAAVYTDFRFDKHFHDVYAVGVVENGVHAFWYRGGWHQAPIGRIVTYQPGEIHNGYAGSEDIWRYRMFYIAPAYIQQLSAEQGWPAAQLPFLRETVINDPALTYWLRRLHLELEAPSLTLERQVLLHQVMSQLLRRYSDARRPAAASTQEPDAIARTIAYIEANYDHDITLDELAQVASFSRSYLISTFRRQVGISPYSFLVQMRLNKAQALLHTGASIAQVALATGFADQSHFTRYFRRTFGVTPGQYLAKG